MHFFNTLKSRFFIALGVFLLIAFVGISACLYFQTHPMSYVWVMDEGDLLNQTHLIKMCSNGRRLWDIQFGQSGQIGYDPIRDILWAPEMNDLDRIHYDQVVKLDGDGHLVDRFQGYRTNILAVDPNNGNVWVQKSAMIPNQAADALITKIDPNGKFLFSKMGQLSSGIWTITLDPRDGTVWIGGHRKLIHLTPEGELLFETSDVNFFSNAPHQIAVHPVNGDIWFTTGSWGGVYKMAWDGTLLKQVYGLKDPVAVAIHSYDGNVWVANYDQPGTGSVTRLSPEGEILLDVKTPDHAEVVGINPYDGVVWVGYDGGMLLLNQNGDILVTPIEFHRPKSLAFGKARSQWKAFLDCVVPN